MPTIDFYLLPELVLEDCYRLVCKLVDKAYLQKRSVYIHTNSANETATLDDLLWIFRDDAFIPHGPVGKSNENIQIGYDVKPKNVNDILINLTEQIPTFINNFQRVLEIIPQKQKLNGRKKYRLYRDQNYEITTHDLTKNG